MSGALILGIDPGLAATGYAVIDAADPTAAPRALGEIKTSASSALAKRLAKIHDGLGELAAEHRPAVVSIESVFTRINVKTALQMAQARGVAILAACAHGAELAEHSPAEIKKLVAGSGRASKDQMIAMVRSLVTLKRKTLSEHMADALAAALCHCRHRQFAAAGGGSPPRRQGRASKRAAWERHLRGE